MASRRQSILPNTIVPWADPTLLQIRSNLLKYNGNLDADDCPSAMKRAFYRNEIERFCSSARETVIGAITTGSESGASQSQQAAWITQIEILQPALKGLTGRIFFEYAVPRMGERIDNVLLIGPVIFVLEFKVGAEEFTPYARDQVWDYALDLNNFHETSHQEPIAPILISTESHEVKAAIEMTPHGDHLFEPIRTSSRQLREVLDEVLSQAETRTIDANRWESGRYSPTPTIIEAARSLYRGHSVVDITRSDAGAINLQETTDAISRCIHRAEAAQHKAICFVTGVPGAGKTLVGLNIATRHLHQRKNTYSVFLSGNGPLVRVLQEALARDSIRRHRESGEVLRKKEALSRVKAFIQNVHHYRDEYLEDERAPIDHVALFDEAQRAWDVQQTSNFMARKKGRADFNRSEPEFLIHCIDRHRDWGVIVCLVGGGQEIHTGEAGIGEWVAALNRSFPDWHIHISSRLTDEEYGAGAVLRSIEKRKHVFYHDELHLGVSMRSFRCEHVSSWVKHLLDLDADRARSAFEALRTSYPVALTRDVAAARRWLRSQSRGSERYGLVASSQGERLKPHAIDVRSPMDPVHWFLDGKDDVRSSYYLEDVATEFSIQGLELDWVGVTWDADFRFKDTSWEHLSFRGSKWTKTRKPERKQYLKNAYRVLLTRARQGMIIIVPEGDPSDHTRLPEFYDPTFAYLQSLGIDSI